LDDAKQLVSDAICAGVFNDLGSGSNVDLCVITREKVDYVRSHRQASVKGSRYHHLSTTITLASFMCTNVWAQLIENVITTGFSIMWSYGIPWLSS